VFKIGKTQSLEQTQFESEIEQARFTTNSARLFFALWPTDEIRAQFAQCAQTLPASFRGRPVDSQLFHLTLVFLGNISLDRIEKLKSIADTVSVPAFTLHFSALHYWRAPKVICLKPDFSPPALMALVSDLEDALKQGGFAFDERKFKPHITIARNVTSAQELAQRSPIIWAINDYVLVESTSDTNGRRYHALARWRLNTTDLAR
jgi:RNA 2',3'-cyclic 3'-phosphodiesterase